MKKNIVCGDFSSKDRFNEWLKFQDLSTADLVY